MRVNFSGWVAYERLNPAYSALTSLVCGTDAQPDRCNLHRSFLHLKRTLATIINQIDGKTASSWPSGGSSCDGRVETNLDAFVRTVRYNASDLNSLGPICSKICHLELCSLFKTKPTILCLVKCHAVVILDTHACQLISERLPCLLRSCLHIH